jgi:MFS family permease
LAFSIWSLGPLNGPVLGPLLGGFASQYLGFRWANWIVLILGVVSFISTCLIKETYPPVLLSKRAVKRRAETGDDRWWCRYEQRADFWTLLRINLTRPFVMAVTEPICIFWNIYIAIIYGIMYMCFVAYPIVFTEIRGWSIGISGLSFTGLGVGGTIVIFLEPVLRRMINRHPKDPETGRVSPEASVSVVCIAAFLAPIGQLWFSWTCTPPVHWIWPILAGVPFGMGNSAVFIYSSSYLTGSFGIYTASALAGNAVVRSMMGGTLPLLGPIMYQNLGPHWAGSLLGFLQILIIPIPLAFYKFGGKIRERSALIRQMRADKMRLDGKARREVEGAEQAVLEAGMAGVQDRERELDMAANVLEGKEAV